METIESIASGYISLDLPVIRRMKLLLKPVIPRSLFVVAIFAAAALPVQALAIQQDEAPPTGQQIYHQHCAECHGDNGAGTEHFESPLAGDLALDQLTKYIEESMPEENPDDCVGEAADKVAQFIFDEFYSPAAQLRRQPARIELDRLTVRQMRERIADLTLAFAKPISHSETRGLDANYFAARNRTDSRKLASQTDPTIDFAEGVPHFDPTGAYPDIPKPKKRANSMNDGFSVYWSGSVIPPLTGDYRFVVESKNGFELFVNDLERPLIDRKVRSDDVVSHEGDRFLLAGRPYSIQLQLFSYPDPPARIRLLWKPPGQPVGVIPQSFLMPHTVSESLAVSTLFPADDASDGYLRGISISREWDDATTQAALETADWIADRIWKLARTKPSDSERQEKIKSFCRQFVERAFCDQLDEQELQFFVGQHFELDLPLTDQVKRVVLQTLKSPRFLYPSLQPRNPSFERANRMARGMWDSIPDETLWKLAQQDRLKDPDEVERQIERMMEDPRTRVKLQSFFRHWLKYDVALQAGKDHQQFPEFDDQLVVDLQRSLDRYLDEIVWGPNPDFRRLFTEDVIYANPRIVDFYDLESRQPESDKGTVIEAASETEAIDPDLFSPIRIDPDQHAGLITHPFLMTGLAYHEKSSPIHRGVFVARNLLGRQLRQPPDNVEPLPEDIQPHLTTRERVELQTSDAACMNCHGLINPLGFSLENYDAVGRFRTRDKDQPVNVAADYTAVSGEIFQFRGPRDLAVFLSESESAQKTFIRQLFQHLAKQPIAAYGPDELNRLHARFVENKYNIRRLIVDMTHVIVLSENPPAIDSQP